MLENLGSSVLPALVALLDQAEKCATCHQLLPVPPKPWLEEVWARVANPIGLIGGIGQAVFAGRMIVQWYVSERQGRSVVPKIFWHMSLWGSVLVLIYAVVEKQLILIVGQSSGLIVYVRNLILLSRKRPETVESGS